MVLLRLVHDDDMTKATVEINRNAGIVVFSDDSVSLTAKEGVRMALALQTAAVLTNVLRHYEQEDLRLCEAIL